MGEAPPGPPAAGAEGATASTGGAEGSPPGPACPRTPDQAPGAPTPCAYCGDPLGPRARRFCSYACVGAARSAGLISRGGRPPRPTAHRRGKRPCSVCGCHLPPSAFYPTGTLPGPGVPAWRVGLRMSACKECERGRAREAWREREARRRAQAVGPYASGGESD